MLRLFPDAFGRLAPREAMHLFINYFLYNFNIVIYINYI